MVRIKLAQHGGFACAERAKGWTQVVLETIEIVAEYRGSAGAPVCFLVIGQADG
jgi:hypothetical protein